MPLSSDDLDMLMDVISDVELLVTEVEDSYCESVCESILEKLWKVVGDKTEEDSIQQYYLRQRYHLPFGADTDKIDIRDYWVGGAS